MELFSILDFSSAFFELSLLFLFKIYKIGSDLDPELSLLCYQMLFSVHRIETVVIYKLKYKI
jgi:hypothetical protein